MSPSLPKPITLLELFGKALRRPAEVQFVACMHNEWLQKTEAFEVDKNPLQVTNERHISANCGSTVTDATGRPAIMAFSNETLHWYSERTDY